MFYHSEPVPRLYKAAAKALRITKEGKSAKEFIFTQRIHHNKSGIYALVVQTLQHESDLLELFDKIDLLKIEPRFDLFMARILFTELIWQKKTLIGESKPFKIVNHLYEEHKDFCVLLSARKLNIKKVVKPRYIRVNTLKLNTIDAVQNFRNEGWNFVRCTSGSYDDYLKQLENLGDYDFITDYHVKVVFAFPSKTSFFNHEAYNNSEIFLQDKATCLAGHVLAPTPGSTILDMCAAPGMKTTHLAQLIKNDGVIYSVEQDKKRFDVLTQFVEASGATCVKLINKDVTLLKRDDCPNIDYILLDPSCSGSGIDRGEPNDFERDRKSGRLERLSNFQAKLLRFALNEFYTAKRVVYSTCSLYPKENEEVIKDVLKNHKGKFRLVSAKEKLNNNWNNTGDLKYVNIGENCIYAKPDSDYTSGFFIAVFERYDDCNVDDHGSKMEVAELDNYNNNDESMNNASDSFKYEKKSKDSYFNMSSCKLKTARNEYEYSDSKIVNEEKEIFTTQTKKMKSINNTDHSCSEQNDIENIAASKKKKKNKCLDAISEDFSQNVEKEVDVLKKKKKTDFPDTTIELNYSGVDLLNKPAKNKTKKKHNVNTDVENNITSSITVNDLKNVEDVVLVTKAKRKSHCKEHEIEDDTNSGNEVVIKKKKKRDHVQNSNCSDKEDSNVINKRKVVDCDENDYSAAKKKRKNNVKNLIVTDNSGNLDIIGDESAVTDKKLKKNKRHTFGSETESLSFNHNGMKSKKKDKTSKLLDNHIDLSVDLDSNENNQSEIVPSKNKKHRKNTIENEKSVELFDSNVTKEGKKLSNNESVIIESDDFTIAKSKRIKKKKRDKDIESQNISINEEAIPAVIDCLKSKKRKKKSEVEVINVSDLNLDNSLVNNNTKTKKKKSSRDCC